MMGTADRERRSARLFYALIVLLLLGYGVMKMRHIQLAFDAYEGQPLNADTTGAAK